MAAERKKAWSGPGVTPAEKPMAAAVRRVGRSMGGIINDGERT